MELTKRAEALKEDLSLSKLLDVVIEICKEIEKQGIGIEPNKPDLPELKTELKKKKK